MTNEDRARKGRRESRGLMPGVNKSDRGCFRHRRQPEGVQPEAFELNERMYERYESEAVR